MSEYTYEALRGFESQVQERLDDVQDQLDRLDENDEVMREPLREVLEARQQSLMAKFFNIQEALVSLSEAREEAGEYDDD